MNSQIELTASRPPTDPSTQLFDLSIYCKSLNIKDIDSYGDYNVTKENSYLKRFESEVGEYVNKNHGLFLISGCMAQSIVLALLKEKYFDNQIDNKIDTAIYTNEFICHFSSHIILHEEQSYKKLLHLEPIIIEANNNLLVQQPISYNDVSIYLDKIPKPLCLIVEIPHREIGGKCTPYEDLVLISNHCRKNGIHLHMDGARFWEATAAYNRPINEITDLFDSIYLSFYKGLGGLTGAMLLSSDEEFIKSARIWSRRFGGNAYTYLPYAVSSWNSFLENKDSFTYRKNRLVEIVKELSEIENKHLVRFDPVIPEVSLIHIYLSATIEQCFQAREEAIRESGISCFVRLKTCNIGLAKGLSYFEMNLGNFNGSLPNLIWLNGWNCFLKHLSGIVNECKS